MGKGTLEVLLVDAKGLADTDFLGKQLSSFLISWLQLAFLC
jgi:hypothetical protein